MLKVSIGPEDDRPGWIGRGPDGYRSAGVLPMGNPPGALAASLLCLLGALLGTAWTCVNGSGKHYSFSVGNVTPVWPAWLCCLFRQVTAKVAADKVLSVMAEGD